MSSIEENKYVKVMFGNKSGANSELEYKINEVNISKNWNPTAENPKDFGGFNYCTEDCILRWLHRGDTLYDVEIPEDAEIIKIETATIVYRSNKIIVKNPRKVTDEMALEFYKKSKFSQKTYYKAMAAVALMDYKNTALTIFKDKIHKQNIEEVLEEWNSFIYHDGKEDRRVSTKTAILIKNMLTNLKN